MTTRVLKPADCLITGVTVFPIRAEITRNVEVDVGVGDCTSQGIVKIKLAGLSNSLIEDSVRIDDTPQPGDTVSFVLTNIATGSESIVVQQHSPEQVEALLNELKALCGEFAGLECRLSDGEAKIRDMDQTFKNAVGPRVMQPKSEPHAHPLTQSLVEGTLHDTMTSLETAWDVRNLKMAETFDSIQLSKCEIELNKEKVAVVRDNVQKLAHVTCAPQPVYDPFQMYQELLVKCHMADRETMRNYRKYIEISIQPNGSATGRVRMSVSYLVNDASWTPKYDLRVRWPNAGENADSTSSKAANSSELEMSVTYMGSVTQRTEEDWKGVKMTLSTSSSSLKGSPPPLLPKNVSIRPPQPERPTHTFNHRRGLMGAAPMPSGCAPLEDLACAPATRTCFKAAPQASFSCQTAVVQAAGAHATYAIPTPHDIPSDGSMRQVTIGILQMPLSLHGVAKPEVSDQMYLLALVKNATKFLLLESRDASVYFEGNFVTKTVMQQVSPADEFTVFMGVDPQVVIKRHPMRTYRKSQGMALMANQKFVDYYEQKLEIHNRRVFPMNIAVVMRLPRALDSRIVVAHADPPVDKLTEIDYTADEDFFKSENFLIGLNKPTWLVNKGTQNVMYRDAVPAQKSTKVTYAYSIEFPKDQVLTGF